LRSRGSWPQTMNYAANDNKREAALPPAPTLHAPLLHASATWYLALAT
jgi:hypothetical protein